MSASLSRMDTVSWASQQLAVISHRKKELATELRVLDRLEADYATLIPAPIPAPEKVSSPRKTRQSSDPSRNGSVTTKVMKALESGPMTIEQLQSRLRARRKTGIASVIRTQQHKGTIIREGDFVTLAPSASSVLVA